MLEDILSRIARAERAAGREPGSVELIAVSKVQPLDRVVAVLEQGHRIFGENYVQEATAKWPDLRHRFGHVSVHMIGPLQTNKAKAAVGLFNAIHTLDRPSLAERLARLAQERGSSPELFVQVNTGEEPQKAGVLPAEADAFIAACRGMDLPVRGLMCIPPEDQDSAPHFAMLADIAARNGLGGLSMGMSGDFEAAIAAGATHVRVGSAIFGARDYSR
ncbi:YggS family pyridoxal phosphate-dependent enzyme [Cereibacter sphaeroides]|uniref:YggS family pyridoxal phosphate-dependent enzyme n=1 Tax=Cereibacter sphaeroides TaxID=1063 RepID=UPI001F1EB296|nr:YggS family pyridoxal phosphate-dependent enzyme [Cereibacter sphaeroides]MCE6949996.1 YggS family pyridoxal phosphate-dependent enzyme [Cereibacter sphaeroides]